jgi:hypothetical protein
MGLVSRWSAAGKKDDGRSMSRAVIHVRELVVKKRWLLPLAD